MSESIARGSALSVLSGWGTLVVGLGTNVIIARVLGPEMKGVLTIFLATQGIFALPGFAIQLGAIHFIAQRRPDWARLKHLLDGVAVVQAFLSAALLWAAIQVPSVRSIVFGSLDPIYVWAMLAALIPILVFMYRSSIMPGLGLPGASALWGALSSFIQSGTLLVPLVWWYLTGASPKVETIIVAGVVATALGSSVWAIPTARISIPAATSVPIRDAVTAIFGFAAPVFVRTVAEWVNRRIDVYFVQAFAGAQQLGVYSVAVGLGQQTWLIPFAISGPLFARVSLVGDNAGSRQLTQYGFRVMAAVSVAIGVMTALVTPILLPLVYGERFRDAARLLLLLLPGIIAVGPSQAIYSYLSAIGRPSEPLRAELFAGCLTVALLAGLVPTFGAAGAALASSGAYIGYTAFLCVRFVRLSQSRWSDLVAFRWNDWTVLADRIRGDHLRGGAIHGLITHLAKRPRARGSSD